MKIEATEITPLVTLDQDNSILYLDGICAPENPHQFFKEVKEMIEKAIDANQKIWFDINLEYFNTSAFKNFIDIFLLLSKKDIDKKMIWRIDEDDEELRESGEILAEVTKFPVEIIEKKD